MIQALNIILGHYSKENGSLAKIGTSKTFSLGRGVDKLDLTHGLEAIRGFYTSVRAATGRTLVNVNVSNAAFYKAGPLDGLMTAFQSGNKFSLEKFLKKVRVQTTHLKERKNKKGEVIPRIKTIFALAYPSDGQRLEHPPKISGYGAGPKEVSFWMDSQANVQAPKAAPGKGKKAPGKAPAASTGGGYITVYDFFVKSKCGPCLEVSVAGANICRQHMVCKSNALTFPSSMLEPRSPPPTSRLKSARSCQAKLLKQSLTLPRRRP
jgi:hypothetical protein